MDGTSTFGTKGARPDFYRFHQGEKVLPFADAEYEARLAGLRALIPHPTVEAFDEPRSASACRARCNASQPYGLPAISRSHLMG